MKKILFAGLCVFFASAFISKGVATAEIQHPDPSISVHFVAEIQDPDPVGIVRVG